MVFLVHQGIRAFTSKATHSHDYRVEPDSYRTQIIVIALLLAIGASGALVLRWSKSETPGRTMPVFSTQPSSSEHAHLDEANSHEHRPNPAAQRAGPPDPETVKTAARSAEDAARAAAELAGK